GQETFPHRTVCLRRSAASSRIVSSRNAPWPTPAASRLRECWPRQEVRGLPAELVAPAAEQAAAPQGAPRLQRVSTARPCVGRCVRVSASERRPAHAGPPTSLTGTRAGHPDEG